MGDVKLAEMSAGYPVVVADKRELFVPVGAVRDAMVSVLPGRTGFDVGIHDFRDRVFQETRPATAPRTPASVKAATARPANGAGISAARVRRERVIARPG